MNLNINDYHVILSLLISFTLVPPFLMLLIAFIRQLIIKEENYDYADIKFIVSIYLMTLAGAIIAISSIIFVFQFIMNLLK